MADIESGAATPIESDAPVVAQENATSETPIESTADQKTEFETKPEAKPKDVFTQAELNKIVQREKAQAYRKAEREAQAREERIRQEVEQRLAKSQPQTQRNDGAPHPSQFNDYESYIDALTEFKVEQRLQGVRQQSEQQQRAAMERERAAQVHAKLAPAATKYPDFYEVVMADDVPISEPMAAAITRLKDGGEVAYYLASNIDEATRISRLNPVDQVWEIREIENRLNRQQNATKAPPPIVPTSGRSNVGKSMSDMSTDEFFAYRQKRSRQR